MDGNLPDWCIRPGSEEVEQVDLKELVGGELSLVQHQGNRLEEEGDQHQGYCKEMARVVEEEQSRSAYQHV